MGSECCTGRNKAASQRAPLLPVTSDPILPSTFLSHIKPPTPLVVPKSYASAVSTPTPIPILLPLKSLLPHPNRLSRNQKKKEKKQRQNTIPIPNSWKANHFNPSEVVIFVPKTRSYYSASHVLISTSLFPSSGLIIKTLPLTDYLMCVGYMDQKSNTYSDCQLGLTGKANGNESPMQAALRETEEELSLTPCQATTYNSMGEKLQHAFHDWPNGSNTTWRTFTSNITNCVAIEKKKAKYAVVTSNPSRRVAMLLYGSLKQLQKAVSEIREFSTEKDAAAYFAFIPIALALEICKKIPTSKTNTFWVTCT